MNLILTEQEAAALLSVTSKAIRDMTSEARINGTQPDPKLAPLKGVVRRLLGKEEP